MYKVLVPVDGSMNALAGVRHALGLGAARSDTEILLVNVQPALHRYVSRFVPRRAAWDARVQRARGALEEARRLVDAAGLQSRSIVLRGDAAGSIARLAAEEKVDQIVVGTSRVDAAAAAVHRFDRQPAGRTRQRPGGGDRRVASRCSGPLWHPGGPGRWARRAAPRRVIRHARWPGAVRPRSSPGGRMAVPCRRPIPLL